MPNGTKDVAETPLYKINVKEETKKPRKKRFANWKITAISLVVAVIAWEIAGRQINPLFFSQPSAIAKVFWVMLFNGSLFKGVYESLQPLFAGYVLAAVIGIPLGLLIGRYRVAEAALGIYVTAGYATPLVALVPLYVVWFGLGFTAKCAIVFSLTVFPLVINTWAGVQNVPKTMVEVGTSFVASQSFVMRKIIIPATIPYIMTGLRLGIGKAIIAVVIAEFFTAVSGLGGIIINAGNSYNTATMFVPVIVLMILGIGLTSLVGVLERKVAPWNEGIVGKE
jgi:ABC-type nitrate/sulfonate/bicarbonate transport system permease component